MIKTVLFLLRASGFFLLASFSYANDITECLQNNKGKVDACVKQEALINHLKAFQQHANLSIDFPGTRFSGSLGYTASRNYIVEKLTAAGYRVSLQDVPWEISFIASPHRFELTRPRKKIYQNNIDYIPFNSSGGAHYTGTVQLPSGDILGCEISDFKHFKPGNIALLERGGLCAPRTKVLHAISAGARGVIMYNNTEGVMFSGLGSPIPSETTPVLLVSPQVGKELKDMIKAGQQPQVGIYFNVVKKTGVSQNILAESIGGNPERVVMVGAHLDSSPGTAGMNDNASAAATILEIALLMKDVNPSNKLRFAWWTGEEIGLLGSTHYIANLSTAEKEKIALYLNYEILGAPNGGRLIMGTAEGVTPPGSEKITQLYADYFTAQGQKFYIFDPNMAYAIARSDMYPFVQVGIPVGYLVTGAEIPWTPLFDSIFTDLKNRKLGVASHPCYHKLCDTLALPDGTTDPNFDFELYLQMSKAAAFAIQFFAMNGSR